MTSDPSKVTGFGQLSPFHYCLGFSMFEDVAVIKLRERFPKYQPSAKELAFGRSIIDERMKTVLMGIGLGLATGLAITFTAFRSKGRVMKAAATLLPVGIGYSISSTLAVVHSFDKWVTFDNIYYNFDSFNDKFNEIEDPSSKTDRESNGISFLAEQFRIDKIKFAPNVAHLIMPILLNPQGLQMVYEIKYEGIESNDAIKRLKKYSTMTSEERLSTAHSLNVLAGKGA